jgi:hypothetical protein
MTTSLRAAPLATACALLGAPAAAQTPSTSSSAAPTRPSTATSAGDTGLWYVPTAEVLARAEWSTSGYRESQNYVEGFSNVSDFAATFAAGVMRGVELFGS